MTGHVTAPAAALADELPSWVRLVRAPNPGPMTLDGTNTWVLRAPGADESVVVDPGPLDEEHLRAVAALGPVAAVLVTHGHPDHVEGLERFVELSGPDRVVAADGVMSLDAAGGVMSLDAAGGVMSLDAAGGVMSLAAAGLRVEVLPTPGHTGDSLSFLASRQGERALLVGDTILGRGTTVVAHPDGDLGAYLDSLQRLTAYHGVTVLPGHGPALADCAAAATFYLAHRRARLDQVRAALAAGAMTAQEVVARVYADVDPSLWPAAQWSVQAQLAYLTRERDGRSEPGRESTPGVSGLDPA